jgi:tetratricopeptide (TPR) repeat protein
MNEQFQLDGFEITKDPKFQNKKYGITSELESQFASLFSQCQHPKNNKIIEKLTELIVKYPAVPILKNYLSTVYNNLGNYKKAQEVNEWILKEHPDYLFARLNKANDYIKKGEYEKVPLVLGNALEIKALYPEREVFHLTEVTSYYQTVIRYLLAIENLELAENRLAIMKAIAPNHHHTDEAESFLLPLRLKAEMEKWKDEIKKRTFKQKQRTKRNLN